MHYIRFHITYFVMKQKRLNNENESNNDNKGGYKKERHGQTNLPEAVNMCKKQREVRAIQNVGRTFQEKWTDGFFFVENNSNPLCLVCQKMCSNFLCFNFILFFTDLSKQKPIMSCYCCCLDG